MNIKFNRNSLSCVSTSCKANIVQNLTYLILAGVAGIMVMVLFDKKVEPIGSTNISSSNFQSAHVYTHDQTNTPIKLEHCTKDQMIKIGEQLGFARCVTHVPAKCKIHLATRCPVSTWLEESFKDGVPSFLGVAVGCNKAYDAIDTARMGMSNPAFDKVKWSEIMDSLDMTDKGCCNQKNSKMFDLKPESNKIKGEMHCIEPMPTTVHSLKTAASDMKLTAEGFIIHHAAISSVDGSIAFPKADKDGKSGVEYFNLDHCKNPDMKKWCEDVPMLSLETYVNTYVNSKGPINVLSIDVEGFDFDVLFGAGSVLDRTEYLEFEYHQVGTWPSYHLSDAVALLDGKGFNCYWAGNGKLWRLTGCMHELYDTWHNWSNVACAHRSQVSLSKTMERIFLETLAA